MEWKEVRLCEVADVQTGPFGSQLHKENYVNKGTPIVTVEHLGNKWFTSQNLPMVSDEDKLRLAKYCSQEGDVIFSRVGSVDRCSYVSKEYSGWLFSGRCLRVRPRSGINPEYLYYFLTNEGTKQYIRNIAVGATMPSINTKLLNEVPITIPSLDDQRRIASILSSLDRKIELNNKINADLEEMAQAIFKNWFVDFEPFKDGKFVDSELGMIPEGWKVGTLGELCNFKRGKNLLTKNAIDEGVPVVAGGLEPSCYHNVANTGAPVITVSGSGANAGFMRMYHVPIWASDCSFIDISCENFYFVYCFLKVNSKLLKHAQTGAVQPHVKPSDIHDFELVIPDKESIYDFQDKVKPFFDRIASLQKESSRLSLLRLSLLPRLMSGELEVPE